MLLLCPLSLSAAAVEVSGSVAELRGTEVRVMLAPRDGAAAVASPAIGDSVDFSTEIDGFALEAGSGRVVRIERDAVWVGAVDQRVQPGMRAIIFATGPPQADDAPVADSDILLAQARAGYAMARSERWSSMQTLRQSGDSLRHMTRWQWTVTWKRPNKLRIDIIDRDGDFLGRPMYFTSVIANDRGWWSARPYDSRRSGERVTDALPEEQIREHAVSGGIFANKFEHWARRGFAPRSAGTTTVDDRPAVRIQLDMPGFSETTYIFDTNTWQVIMDVRRRADGSLVSNKYSDFRSVEGVEFPFLHEYWTKDGMVEATTRSVEFDVDVPDSAFVRPR